MDEKQLKELCRETVIKYLKTNPPVLEPAAEEEAKSTGKTPKQPPVKIKQAKIVRAKDRVDANGVGRSTGFGFVEFEHHPHALIALRQLNNNPDVYGPARRPIIEFAVENTLVSVLYICIYVYMYIYMCVCLWTIILIYLTFLNYFSPQKKKKKKFHSGSSKKRTN